MLFFIFAVLTGLAIFSVLWPLVRAKRHLPANDSDIAFYKAQLAEIERDAETGQVAEADVEAAKTAAARRLISAAETPAQKARPSVLLPRLAAIFAVVLIPVLATGLYLKIGHPDQPDAPLYARSDLTPREAGFMAAIAKVEAHLQQNPQDGRGYEVLAPIYLRLGRTSEALNAYQKALVLLGESAVRRADYAEALVVVAGGKVSDEALASFQAAVSRDGTLPKARFYLGLAAEQAGDKGKAQKIWEDLVADAPPDAPWLEPVKARLASLDPSRGEDQNGAESLRGQAKAIANLPEAQRNATIRAMVDGLASRLAANGQDIEGWLRLMRAYSVLQEADKARLALTDARKNMAGNSAALGRIDALARELGLEG